MLINTAATVVLGAVMSASSTGEPPAGITLHTHEGETDVRYAVYRPAGLPADEPAPAIVFLHGYGECGTDGTRHLMVGLMPKVLWDSDRWPFVVILPQKPEFNVDWEHYDDEVMAILDQTIADQNIDPERVAITGLSQGGHGTIAFASAHPDRFAAAAPVCSYVGARFSDDGVRSVPEPPTADSDHVRDAAEAMSGMPVWLFHGDRDNVVSPDESRALHGALQDTGADVTLTIFPEANHNSWDPAYSMPELAAWFGEHLGVDR